MTSGWIPMTRLWVVVPVLISAAVAAAADLEVAVAGDFLVVEPPAATCRDDVARALAPLAAADLAVANLETALVPAETPPAPTSGGLWLRAEPAPTASWLAGLGLDGLSVATNHAGDWGRDGLAATRATVRRHGLVALGHGASATEAMAAVPVSVGDTTAAVVAARCAPPEDPMRPANATADFAARPGVATLDVRRVVTLAPVSFERLAAALRASGHRIPVGASRLELDGALYRAGVPPAAGIEIAPGDRRLLLDAVATAARDHPVVLVSLHCADEGPGGFSPPAALRDLAHAAVGRGADTVFVHGPHHVRGVEWVAPSGAALYGLGSVVLQHHRVASQPPAAAARWGLPPDAGVATLLHRVEAAMGPADELWAGLVARLHFAGAGRLESVELIPLDLAGTSAHDPCRGLPVPAGPGAARRLLEKVARRSTELGGRLRLEGDVLRLTAGGHSTSASSRPGDEVPAPAAAGAD